MWAAAPMTAFRVQCDIRSFEKSVYLLIVSSIKVDFYGIQADFSCMFFLRSVMIGCISPRNIRGPDKGDCHSFPIERMDAR